MSLGSNCSPGLSLRNLNLKKKRIHLTKKSCNAVHLVIRYAIFPKFCTNSFIVLRIYISLPGERN